MKGLELSELYYRETGLPVFEREYPELCKKLAFGLAGAGSECCGYDDELSKDHDFGVGFYIWAPEDIYDTYGTELKKLYNSLPEKYQGVKKKTAAADGSVRCGLFEIHRFFRQYIGTDGVPTEPLQWFAAPESAFWTVTSGKVFKDDSGEFSRIFDRLRNGYPEDVRKKKISARAFAMAQSGQYNYKRCLQRGDRTGAFLALTEFVRAAVSMIHLLQGRYTPFYKWAGKSLEEISEAEESVRLLSQLCFLNEPAEAEDIMEALCSKVSAEMNRQNLSLSRDSFLLVHAKEIMLNIEEDQIRNLPIQFG